MAESSSTSGCELTCLAIFDPVCASNGDTFGNACEFNQSRCLSGDDLLEIVSQGACPSSSSSGGSGCLQEFVCLDAFTPVCGSDGQTYSNECFLTRAQCVNPTLTQVSVGECSLSGSSNSSAAEGDSGVGSVDAGICTKSLCANEFLPRCGSDGLTYGNQCLFQNAQCVNSSLTLAFNGECSAASGVSTSGSGTAVGSDATAASSESMSSETDGASASRKRFTLVLAATALLAMLAL